MSHSEDTYKFQWQSSIILSPGTVWISSAILYLLISRHFITTHTLGLLQSSRKFYLNSISELSQNLFLLFSLLSGHNFSSQSFVWCFSLIWLPWSFLGILTVHPYTLGSSISSDHCSSQFSAPSKGLPNAVQGGTNVLVSVLKKPEISYYRNRVSYNCLYPPTSIQSS